MTPRRLQLMRRSFGRRSLPRDPMEDSPSRRGRLTQTAIRRAGEERIWALLVPEQKPGLWTTLFGGRHGAG
jgi:hypothetical protein